MGNLRIVFVLALLVLAGLLCRSHVSLGFVLLILIVGLFLTGMMHVQIENSRDRARRAVRFYQSGLDRLNGTWAGKGSGGTEFLNTHHPYAADLAECQCEGIRTSHAIQRLARLYSLIISSGNLLFVLVCRWLMWDTQFAFAIEAWRARFGPMVALWLTRLGEIEALSSLASYAFEHPADPFPELLSTPAPAQLEAEELGHPLMTEARCVRNSVRLGPACPLVVISGSNMSGKSTYLRALGVNLVLAMAGAPVRARKFRIMPVQIGASIRTVDSLLEGTSRYQVQNGRMTFDYQLRPGIVDKSNALELMRSVGLDVR